MKIIDRLEQVHEFIENDPKGAGGEFAQLLQKLAADAICAGWKTVAWEKYMRHFASNTDQLKRLRGDEDDFNTEIYGPTTLAYMVANSTCAETTSTKTYANMSDEMKTLLDAPGLPDQLTHVEPKFKGTDKAFTKGVMLDFIADK